MENSFFKNIVLIFLTLIIGKEMKGQQTYETCLTYDTSRTLPEFKNIILTTNGAFEDNLKACYLQVINAACRRSSIDSIRNKKFRNGDLPIVFDNSYVVDTLVNWQDYWNGEKLGERVFLRASHGLYSKYAVFKYGDVIVVWAKLACGNPEWPKKYFEQSGNEINPPAMKSSAYVPRETRGSRQIEEQVNESKNKIDSVTPPSAITAPKGTPTTMVPFCVYTNKDTICYLVPVGTPVYVDARSINTITNTNTNTNTVSPTITNTQTGSVPTQATTEKMVQYDYGDGGNRLPQNYYLGQSGQNYYAFFPQQQSFNGGIYNPYYRMYQYPLINCGFSFDVVYSSHPRINNHDYGGPAYAPGHSDVYTNNSGGPTGVGGHKIINNTPPVQNNFGRYDYNNAHMFRSR